MESPFITTSNFTSFTKRKTIFQGSIYVSKINPICMKFELLGGHIIIKNQFNIQHYWVKIKVFQSLFFLFFFFYQSNVKTYILFEYSKIGIKIKKKVWMYRDSPTGNADIIVQKVIDIFYPNIRMRGVLTKRKYYLVVRDFKRIKGCNKSN